MPEELKRREDRLAAIREAKARLEAEQRAADDARGVVVPVFRTSGRLKHQAALRLNFSRAQYGHGPFFWPAAVPSPDVMSTFHDV